VVEEIEKEKEMKVNNRTLLAQRLDSGQARPVSGVAHGRE
jgi:hypothetical protein